MLALAAVLALSPAASAATDQITAMTGDVFTGGTGAGGSTNFLLDAGTNPSFVNADTVDSHNVVSTDMGPDREPLFSTELIQRGESAVVPGTQYLAPATYAFLCTIHVGMEGSLTVSGPGAASRPDIDVSVASSKLKKVAKGKLKVELVAATAGSGIELEANLGAKVLGGSKGIALDAGQTRTVTLKLDNRARKLLADRDKAKVVVDATVPYGAPASAKRTLK